MNFTSKTYDTSSSFSVHTMPKKHQKKEKVIVVYIPIASVIPRQKHLSKEEQIFKVFETLIQEYYHTSQLKLKDFAQKMHLSQAQLYRKVKALTNQSPITYLRLYRLGKAKELLEYSPSLSISEIAYQVGFNDPNYFSRTFSAFFGMTPSTMRQTFK